MKFRSRFTRVRIIFSIVLLSLSTVVLASNILEADQHFTQEDYEKAMVQYQAAAEIGNPRAYFQMGVMHHRGLGTEVDNVKALIWFSLAAEHGFESAADIVEQLMAMTPAAEQARMQAYITAFQQQYGQSRVGAKYYPVINKANLSAKVNFGGDTQLSAQHNIVDEHFEADSFAFEDDFDTGFEYDEDDGFNQNVDGFGSFSAASHDEFFNKPYFLVVDYDIAPDGSRRDPVPVQTMGATGDGLYQLATSSVPQPKFMDQGINFIARSHLGIANYDKHRIKESHSYIYTRYRRLAIKYAEGETPEEQYRYAVMLMNFTWLKREEGEVDSLLESAALAGHPQAQFDYGLKLYREQTDPEQALFWLTKAGKEGITGAEYRLGRILLDSPWVIEDETKALFWLNAAAEKNHTVAIRKVAELKLLANDSSLHDIDGASRYLSQIADTQAQNPEYHYLRAISYKNMKPRQLSKAVTHINEAIDLGEDFNWDVSQWQQLLAKWTSRGSVTVQGVP